MTSLLCVKSHTGNVQVHSEKSAEILATDNDDDDKKRTTFMPRPRSKSGNVGNRPMSTPNLTVPPSQLKLDCATSSLRNMGNDHESWLDKKYVQELQELSLQDSSPFHRLCNPLLETEHTFVKDVSNYLEHKDMLELRKKELLHKNWNSRVYEPIRHKVLGAMNSDDWLHKDRRRRELHRQYLEHVNKKGHVFLDTMDEGEYYAQALNHHRPAPITVQTENLQDPLLAQERDRNREDQTILRCVTGELYSLADIDQVKLPPLPLVPLGRHGTDSTTWLEMPLGNIESTPRQASRLRMKGNCTDTQIDFPQWSKMKFDASILDHEMQLQKKRMFEEKPPYGVPARQFAKAPFATKTTSTEQNALCAVKT